MKRVLGAIGGLVLVFGLAVPAVLADAPLPHTGRVLISVEGDVAIGPGEHADVVVVVQGNADIRGEVNTLVVADGTATVVGATLETIVAAGSQVELGAGTVVYGAVQRVDSVVHQSGNAEVQGGIVDLSGRLFELGAAVAPILTLLWLGFGLANVAAGLFLAAVAGRQMRTAQRTISRQPVLAFVAGILSAVLVPIAAVLLFPTIVGAPLGFGILVVALPLVAFAGYLVAAAWAGEWILRALGTRQEPERPYLATVVGVILLGALGLVPVANLLVAIAGLFGFGAVVVSAIRTIVGGSRPIPGAAQPTRAATVA